MDKTDVEHLSERKNAWPFGEYKYVVVKPLEAPVVFLEDILAAQDLRTSDDGATTSH